MGVIQNAVNQALSTSGTLSAISRVASAKAAKLEEEKTTEAVKQVQEAKKAINETNVSIGESKKTEEDYAKQLKTKQAYFEKNPVTTERGQKNREKTLETFKTFQQEEKEKQASLIAQKELYQSIINRQIAREKVRKRLLWGNNKNG